MVICIVDKEKDPSNLEKFLVSKSLRYKLTDDLQEGLNLALNPGVTAIFLDTDKNPKISFNRLKMFCDSKSLPCTILTNSATLSSQINVTFEGDSLIRTCLYGNDYPDLNKYFSLKKKIKKKEIDKKKTDYQALVKKVISVSIVFFASLLLTYYFYQLLSGHVRVADGKIITVISWFGLGLISIMFGVYRLSSEEEKPLKTIIYLIATFVAMLFQFKFFLPFLIIGCLFLFQFLVMTRKINISKKIETRKDPRYPITGLVHLIPSKNSESFNGELIDISLSGARVSCRKMLIKGEEVKINNDFISIFAEVMRVTPTESGFEVGLKFQFVTSKMKDSLISFIRENRLRIT